MGSRNSPQKFYKCDCINFGHKFDGDTFVRYRVKGGLLGVWSIDRSIARIVLLGTIHLLRNSSPSTWQVLQPWQFQLPLWALELCFNGASMSTNMNCQSFKTAHWVGVYCLVPSEFKAVRSLSFAPWWRKGHWSCMINWHSLIRVGTWIPNSTRETNIELF